MYRLSLRHVIASSCCRSVSARAILSLAAAGLTAIIQASQQDTTPPVFKSDVSLVEVDTSVCERGTGKPVANLSANDFVITQDGKTQLIAKCEYATAPLDLVIVADVSGSVVNHVRELANMAEDAMNRSFKPFDRLAIVTFSSRITTIQEWTGDYPLAMASLRKALSHTSRVEPGTRVFAVLVHAASLFEAHRQPSRRRAILVLSDDKDGAKEPSEQQTLSSLLESDATVFGILLPTPEQVDVIRQGTSVNFPVPLPTMAKIWRRPPSHYRSSRQIIETTGGEAISTQHDQQSMATALERIRFRYVLAYYPDPPVRPGQKAFLDIKLAPAAAAKYPGTVIRHRKIVYGSSS